MSAVGWLHAGSMLKTELCSTATCRNRQVDCSTRPLGLTSTWQVHDICRARCVRSHAASSGTTAQPATSQQQLQPVQQQWRVSAFSQQEHRLKNRSQQEVVTAVDEQQQQQQQVNTTAIDKPELVTAAIRRAPSIQQLQAVLHTHGALMNHIHISAAFVQLQRLWTSSSGGSSSSSSSSNTSSSSSSSSSSSNGRSSTRAHPSSPRATLLQLQQLAQGLQRVDGRYCANVLYSTAVLEQQEPAAYCPPLIEQVCAASFELVNLMTPQELATCVWALAGLDIIPAPQLLRRFLSNILRKLPGFGPQDLIMTLSGLPRLSATGRVEPYATVHKLAAAAERQLAAASPLDTALLLAVLAGVHYQPSAAWLSSFYAHSEPRLASMGPAALGMAGWALGKMSPVAQAPPASWVQSWEAALAACIHGQQQQQLAAGVATFSLGRSSCGSPAVVEVVMGVYGWSKAAPGQPPSPAFQQLLYSSIQQAMTSDSSSSLTVQQQQQQQAVQRQQQQQPQRLSSQQQLQREQQSSLRSMVWNHSQQHFVAQQCHGISARLLVELLAAAARWQQLPPRSWLLEALGQLQLQLVAGKCSSREISNLLWALASLGIQPNQEWMAHCTSALQQQVQSHMQQQQQQGGAVCAAAQPLQPRQLAAALWALRQLDHPASSLWGDIWAASQPMLQSFTLADIVITLEAAVEQRQPPPAAWLESALAAAVCKAAGAAADLTPAPAAGAAAARSAVGSTAERKRAKKQQGQQRRRQALKHAAAAGAAVGGAAAAAAVSRASSVGPDLVRLCTAAARLGAAPGHRWCCQLLQALQPAAQQISQQCVCRLVWCLGKLGYRPAGGGLTGWLAARLAGPDSPVGSCSPGQLRLLLAGLRACGGVLGGPWMQQLLQYTQTAARQMPLEVLVQLLRYVAAARIRPPSTWSTAVTAALEVTLSQQQQQQQCDVTGVVASLVQLRIAPSPELLLQLQQHCEAGQSELTQEQLRVQAKWLQKLQQVLAVSEQQQLLHLDTPAMQPPLQQQQQQGVVTQQGSGSAAAGLSQPDVQQQQQPRQIINGTANSVRAGSQPNGHHNSSSSGSSSNSIVSNSGNSWTGAVWMASNVAGASSSSSSSSSVSVGSVSE